MAEIRVLIVDDLEHVRQGLHTLLELSPDLVVVGEACNGLQAIHLVSQLQPDVVLMDLEMPELDGFEATRRIKDLHPGIGVVVITIHDTGSDRERAARAGADAFRAKGNATEVLIETIREVGKQDSSKIQAQGGPS